MIYSTPYPPSFHPSLPPSHPHLYPPSHVPLPPSPSRVTSVNRISFGSTDSSSVGVYTGEQCVIQLIPHLNLNAPRLQQILQGTCLTIIEFQLEHYCT